MDNGNTIVDVEQMVSDLFDPGKEGRDLLVFDEQEQYREWKQNGWVD